MNSNLLVGVIIVLFFVLFTTHNTFAQESTLDLDLAHDIMMCESSGDIYARNDADAKITGYSSFGIFQFQPKTFLLAGKRFKVFPEWFTLADAMKYIYRPEYQGAIAHGLLANQEYFHWKNCFNKVT